MGVNDREGGTMTIVESLENGVVIMKVDGRLNAVTSLELHDKLMEFMPKAQKLIFEFEDLEYISSGGLRELLIAYDEMSRKDGMVIRHVSPEVEEVLNLTGFSTIFEIEE